MLHLMAPCNQTDNITAIQKRKTLPQCYDLKSERISGPFFARFMRFVFARDQIEVKVLLKAVLIVPE